MDSKEIILSLKRRIELLISGYEKIAEENRILSSELNEYRDRLINNDKTIEELKNKIDKLQMIEAFKASSSDSAEAKQKVGKLIKEIDRCIALLND